MHFIKFFFLHANTHVYASFANEETEAQSPNDLFKFTELVSGRAETGFQVIW